MRIKTTVQFKDKDGKDIGPPLIQSHERYDTALLCASNKVKEMAEAPAESSFKLQRPTISFTIEALEPDAPEGTPHLDA